MLLNSNMDAGNNSEPPKHIARHEAVPGLPHTPRPTHATPASFGWHSFIFGSLSWLSAHCSDLDPKLLGIRTLTCFSQFRGSFSQTSSQLLYKFVICRAEVVVCACLWRRADTWVAQAMNWIALAGFNRPHNEIRRKMPKLLKRWDISFALLISFLSQGINNAIGTDSPREETQ